MSEPYRLNLKKIEQSLYKIQKEFERINLKLDVRRDPLEDIIIENMLLGYEYVDRLLQRRISLLQRRAFHHVLELNHIVLCGTRPHIREEFRQHISATTDRFYEQEKCNIGHLGKWYKEHKQLSPWKRAAGIYILHLSQPQLFFEGNHRTGALIMSHILAADGKPPFVLRVANAEAYFNPSTLAKMTRKSMVTNLYKLPKIRKKFAKFLKEQARAKYLTAS